MRRRNAHAPGAPAAPFSLAAPVALAALAALAALSGLACAPRVAPPPDDDPTLPADPRARLRAILERRGIHDTAVLAAMGRVPRDEFVLPEFRAHAWEDRPLPIDEGQTISEPFVVAHMTALAALAPGARVLEIGTGSGYQAAVLAEMGADVYTIEILAPLARAAAARLARLGYTRVHTRTGDGWRGWPEAAPFDAILVTAATPAVPPPLAAQLAPGGRLVLPLGTDEEQELVVVTRTPAGLVTRHVAPVLFVPMTGEAGKRRPHGPSARSTHLECCSGGPRPARRLRDLQRSRARSDRRDRRRARPPARRPRPRGRLRGRRAPG